MSKLDRSFTLRVRAKLVIPYCDGTTDSTFTLMRGVPASSDKRMEDYLWTEVIKMVNSSN